MKFYATVRTGRTYVVVCTVSFATAFGCLSLTMQLLLFRKNHARLACSVVNALTTARCRYQLLRIADRACPCPQQISYKIKFTDNRKGCPYGCANIFISYQPKIVIYQRHSNGCKQLLFLCYIVGANCVRLFLIHYELAGDHRSPLRVCEIFQRHIRRKLSYINNNSTAGASPCPTPLDI